MGGEDRLQLQVEVWKKTVDVQQHFNDIELRIRGLALTVLTAVLGAAALALRYRLALHVQGLKIELASVLVIVGFIVWMAFYFVDQVWYHRLLIGAVRHGEMLEEMLNEKVPGIGLTKRISQESPYSFRFLRKSRRIHSKHKLKIFYWSIAVLLIVAVILLEWGNPSVSQDKSPDKASQSSASVISAKPLPRSALSDEERRQLQARRRPVPTVAKTPGEPSPVDEANGRSIL